MATYKIEIIPRAEKEFRALDRRIQLRISKVILGLSLDPFPLGAVKLSGFEGIYRIRVGQYRILYKVEKRIVTIFVVKIGHRREVYR